MLPSLLNFTLNYYGDVARVERWPNVDRVPCSRCHFLRHFDAYFTGITRVKNGNGDINIRVGVYAHVVGSAHKARPNYDNLIMGRV